MRTVHSAFPQAPFPSIIQRVSRQRDNRHAPPQKKETRRQWTYRVTNRNIFYSLGKGGNQWACGFSGSEIGWRYAVTPLRGVSPPLAVHVWMQSDPTLTCWMLRLLSPPPSLPRGRVFPQCTKLYDKTMWGFEGKHGFPIFFLLNSKVLFCFCLGYFFPFVARHSKHIFHSSVLV